MKKLTMIALVAMFATAVSARPHHHHGGFGTGVAIGTAVGAVIGTVASAVASPTVVTTPAVVTPTVVTSSPVVYQTTYTAPVLYAPTGVVVPNYTVSGGVIYKDPGPYYSPYVPRYHGGYVSPYYGIRPCHVGYRPAPHVWHRPHGGHHRR